MGWRVTNQLLLLLGTTGLSAFDDIDAIATKIHTFEKMNGLQIWISDEIFLITTIKNVNSKIPNDNFDIKAQ